ncbi:hypothetical protein QQ045_009952 [Rhodiola kirilowii]
MTDVIITVLFVLFSVGFLSMCIHYIRTRIGQTTLTIEIEAPQPPVAKGIDSEAINALPIFKYSDVKDGMIGRGVAQCAVCLSDFEDEDPVRVLPGCYHVFHSHCVDEWLASHATCPVCRTNLISISNDPINPERRSDSD